MTNRAEYHELRRQVRKHRRNARASMLAFVVAVGLLAFSAFQSASYWDALQKTTAAMESQSDESGDVEAMLHYIRTLQGKVNACRERQGEPPINFEKY